MPQAVDRTVEEEDGAGTKVASVDSIHQSRPSVQKTRNPTSRIRLCTPTDSKGHRMSIFKEIGLDSHAFNYVCYDKETASITSTEKLPLNSAQHKKEEGNIRSNIFNRLPLVRRTKLVTVNSNSPSVPLTNVSRFRLLVFLIAVVLPVFLYVPGSVNPRYAGSGATADIIRHERQIKERTGSPTNICKRWSHQGELLGPQT